MNKIKRMLSYMLCLGMMSLMMAGCQKTPESTQSEQNAVQEITIDNKEVVDTETIESTTPTELKTLNIAALNGPTGIGIAKMMEDASEAYNITLYQSSDEIVAKIVTGEIDIACIASNLGAVLYNKTEKNIALLATNTLGTLYIVENGETIESISDLKGKEIYASGKGSAPEFILKHLLEVNGLKADEDVTINYLSNHSDVASQLIAQEGTIALLPQPFVTTVEMKSEAVRIAVDLNEAWVQAENMDLPMGIIVVQKELLTTQKNEIEKFLADYEASINFVDTNLSETANLVEKYGIVANAKVAELAIPKCHITYLSASDSKNLLQRFYTILHSEDPKAVGGAVPDEAFYGMD
jgi:NitT/TauT family transport system substrate-binding protein